MDISPPSAKVHCPLNALKAWTEVVKLDGIKVNGAGDVRYERNSGNVVAIERAGAIVMVIIEVACPVIGREQIHSKVYL